jgi:hypothetical protein
MKQLITLFLLVICLISRAQDPEKTALTAGCEFSDFKAEVPSSITSGYQIIDFQGSAYYKFPQVEQQLSSPPSKSVDLYNTSKNNPGIYALIFFLVAAALFFIIKNKNRILSPNKVNLETEDDNDRKKQLWNALSEPAIEE